MLSKNLRHPEYQYITTLDTILKYGERVPNRTGVDTLRVLGVTHRYDFEDGFPLLTTKKVWMKGVVHELLWFLKGETNIKYLVDNGVNIWTDDAYRKYKEKTKGECTKKEFVECVKSEVQMNDYVYGDLGPVYGTQWRKWTSPAVGYDDTPVETDQIANLIHNLKNNPGSRRHILSAWKVDEVDQMGLPPCHVMSQFTIFKGKLWCQMYQRSCDMFLGVPFNIASYALLTHMIAQVVGIPAGGFIHAMHDTHIYENHIDAVQEQLKREPLPFSKLVLNPEVDDIDKFTYDDISVEGYVSHEKIKAELNT